jgi:hypothetical protein
MAKAGTSAPDKKPRPIGMAEAKLAMSTFVRIKSSPAQRETRTPCLR